MGPQPTLVCSGLYIQTARTPQHGAGREKGTDPRSPPAASASSSRPLSAAAKRAGSGCRDGQGRGMRMRHGETTGEGACPEAAGRGRGRGCRGCPAPPLARRAVTASVATGVRDPPPAAAGAWGGGGHTTGRRGRDGTGGVLSVRGCSERDLLRGLPLGRGLCRCPQPVTRRRGSSEPGTPSPAPGRGAPGLCGLARAGGARRDSPDSPVPPLLGAGPVRCFGARPVLTVPGGCGAASGVVANCHRVLQML